MEWTSHPPLSQKCQTGAKDSRNLLADEQRNADQRASVRWDLEKRRKRILRVYLRAPSGSLWRKNVKMTNCCGRNLGMMLSQKHQARDSKLSQSVDLKEEKKMGEIKLHHHCTSHNRRLSSEKTKRVLANHLECGLKKGQKVNPKKQPKQEIKEGNQKKQEDGHRKIESILVAPGGK